MQIGLLVTTVLSVAVAAAMSTVAWRLRRDDRRRSEARVAALASEFGDLEVGPAQVASSARLQPVREASTASADLFRSWPRSGSRLAVVFAVGAFVVATAVALTVVAGHGEPFGPGVGSGSPPPPRLWRSADALREGGSRTPQTNVAAQATVAGSSTEAVPLELVALEHDRDADRITVRGVVRNPVAGAPLNRLAAVVFLFNRDGGFLMSGRAAVESATLAPGAQSTFIVTAMGASDIGRYRVSFRVDDRIVPHVDRRDRGPVVQLGENP